MATRGEVISQTAPAVTITGSVSGSITFDPASATTFRRVPSIETGTARVLEYVAQGANKGTLHLDTIVGTATVTVTASGGTQVHYRIGPKNPTSKGTTSSLRVTDKYVSQSIIYGGAFTIEKSRPGSNVTTLRLRAYKIDSDGQAGISPNEKSEVVIIRFIHNT